MKRILRYLAAMMAAIMVATCMLPAYAAQAQTTQYDENYIFTDIYDAADYLSDEFRARKETVNVTFSNALIVTDVRTTLLEALNNAGYYWETDGITYNVKYVTGGVTVTITPQYDLTLEQYEMLENEIDRVLDSLDLDGKSEYQKVRVIHDYICDNVNYDYSYSKYSAYDALITGESVCQGYANLFYLMCDDAGLNARLVTGIGNGGGHAWNIVEIDGGYYNIDTTWDGQSDTTRYTYFLNNDADFGDHERDSEYSSTGYYTKFPMAQYSWVDYSGLDNEKADIANLASDTFTTIDGGTVTNQAENGKSKILIFGSTDSSMTQANIKNVSLANLTNVDVVFMEYNSASLSEVTSFKNTYGNGNSKIKYAYNTQTDIYSLMWEYVRAIKGVSSTYIPVILFIDANNRIQYFVEGENISTSAYENYAKTYFSNEEIVTLSKNSLGLNKGDSEKLTAKIYGQAVNAQFVTWTSSNPSVATVDYNGVVKGINAGTATITCKVNDKISYSCKVTVTSNDIPDGLNKGSDGLWGYYKDGKLDVTFTGLATNAYGTWYISKGRINTKFTGLYKYNGKWQYISNGKLNATYTGAAKNAYGTWYMKNGKIDTTFTGLYKYEGKWQYFCNGKLDATYTGAAANDYGVWYLNEGKIDTTFTGLCKYEGRWQYFKNGKLNATYTGVATNAYGTWYMENGSINTKFTGLYKYENKWQYFKNGKLNATYTGLGKNAYGTWYLKNGKIASTYNGKVTISGVTYTIKNGKVVS